MSKTKQSKLDALGAEIQAASICPELAVQATNLVMGTGNPDASIVLIGEAPGKKEDEQGVPFVGASGRFLNEMLEAAGMDRHDVYITNIVKYRPPNNRDPTSQEKQAFGPYLARQLEIIQPQVIMTLGRHSMEFFLPGVKISEVHGTVIRTQGVTENGMSSDWLLVPLYHPAAALYNGSLRKTLVEDFLRTATFVSSL